MIGGPIGFLIAKGNTENSLKRNWKLVFPDKNPVARSQGTDMQSGLSKVQKKSEARACEHQLTPTVVASNDEKALRRELARLDDEFEAGKIKTTEYNSKRSVTKSRLVELFDREKESRK